MRRELVILELRQGQWRELQWRCCTGWKGRPLLFSFGGQHLFTFGASKAQANDWIFYCTHFLWNIIMDGWKELEETPQIDVDKRTSSAVLNFLSCVGYEHLQNWSSFKIWIRVQRGAWYKWALTRYKPGDVTLPYLGECVNDVGCWMSHFRPWREFWIRIYWGGSTAVRSYKTRREQLDRGVGRMKLR